MDIAERRANVTSQALLKKSRTKEDGAVAPTPPAEPDPVTPEPVETVTPDPVTETAPKRQSRPQAEQVAQSPSRTVEEDLFEASADRMVKAMTDQRETRSVKPVASATSFGHELHREEGYVARKSMFDLHDDHTSGDFDIIDATAEPTPSFEPEDEVEIVSTQRPRGDSLSDIIADMERDERSTLSREETAEALLGQLKESGIQLTDVFRPKDKKKIAHAARKGDDHRRSATNQQVGRQVERVRQRLRGNLEMMTLARDFLALEESDALNALENTHASNKNASARLATYLLLDAAVT